MDSRQISEIRHVAERRARFGNTKYEIRNGSAIIFAIVLTTLLAMLGVLFLLSSRVDSVATSAVGDNQDLKLAVDTVVAQISEVLTRDVPGVDPNGTYYDYPDGNNPWLASLEPDYSGVWPHVTDLYYPYPYPYRLGPLAYYLVADVNYEHKDHAANGIQSDADGDGASDSMWVQIPGKMSAKGKPIYAAIRIIDNGGMLNVNTGYKFDPNSSVGSSQTQINLMALADRPGYTLLEENALKNMRTNYPVSGLDPNNLGLYEQNVIWRYGNPDGNYTPFDISDELEMRYRFLIDQGNIHTRLESWSSQFSHLLHPSVLWTPFDNSSGANVPKNWITHTYDSGSLDPNYSYRHIATTYNMDRIINPNGQKMFNINSPITFDKNLIYNTVRAALDPNIPNSTVALITANLMDYIDGPNYPTGDPRYDPNNEVTEVNDPCTGTLYYGFERPCVYISEIAQIFFQHDQTVKDPDPNVYRSYAIELFKPYWEDDEPNGWRIKTEDVDSDGNPLPPNYTTIHWTGSRRFHVLANINTTVPEANIPIDLNEFPGPNEAGFPDPGHLPQSPADINFAKDTAIVLQRYVNGSWIPVDVFTVPSADAYGSGWLDAMDGQPRSFERDITVNRCIRRVLNTSVTTPTIGSMNHPFNSGGDMIQAHPANKTFTNIGEIGQLFRNDAYNIGPADREYDFFDSNLIPPAMREGVRVDLTMPVYQNLFKYLTVIDPYDHGSTDPNKPETRIKGRININTAPWFVLAQLPWVSWIPTEPLNYRLAQAIVAYRDKTLTTSGIDFSARPGLPGFQSIGQLNNVISIADPCSSIGYYEGRGNIIPTTLLTPTDGVGDAFEERDVIFDRISNLVTVRSDVFTAYILVRIGTDGPQKRVVAIFDRSEVPAKKVKIIAIQPVPDPR